MNQASIYRTRAGEELVQAQYDAQLARWPVPCETFNLPTRHGTTFVVASGPVAAPPLILLHGAGTNSATWMGDVGAYTQHYRVYAVDLLGEAGKSAPHRPDWACPAYAEWLMDVLQGLHTPQAILVGLSQGAWCALKLACAQPALVQKLVLLTPGGVVPDKAGFLPQAIGLSLLGAWGRRRLTRLILAGQPIPSEVEAALLQIQTHFRPRLATLPLFTDAELRRLTMPVLLLMGARDVLRDAEKIVARLKPLLPQLQVQLYSDGGHALLNTTPRILPFLNAG
jgi:pimeloyl-ACP methyl ester carboxylesterase